MNVQPLIGSTGFPQIDQDSGQLIPYDFLVSSLAIGEDPLSHPIIPRLGSDQTIGGYKYFCDWVGVTQVHSDNAVTVTARFSTDGRFRFPVRPRVEDSEYRAWDLGYKKVEISVPQFSRGVRTYKNASGQNVTTDWWYKTDKKIPIELRTLNVQLTLTGISNQAVLDVVNLIDDQHGRLHQFAGRYWVMQPASIRSTKPTVLSIQYAWESDPGNGAVGLPEGVTSADMLVAPQRDPFFAYDVIPSRSLGAAPTIVVQDLFPNDVPNPYIDLDGWRNLPGRPI